MPGPPRKPPGTAHRDGHESPGITIVEPKKGDILIPDPPSGLLKVSRETWERYWRSAVSSAVDLGADGGLLERWIRSVDEWHRTSKAFRAERVVENAKGVPVLNPLAAHLKHVENEVSRCEQQLGLTPMSRLRLGMVIGQARITAEELNRSLSEPSPAGEPDAIDAEWEQA